MFRKLFKKRQKLLTRDEMIQWCNDHLNVWPSSKLPKDCGWTWVVGINRVTNEPWYSLEHINRRFKRIYETDI